MTNKLVLRLATIGATAGLILSVLALVLLLRGPTAAGGAAIGGPFTLVDQNGRTVTQAVLQGQPTLVFFGYTHCPDVCPTTLSDLSATLAALGPDTKAQAIFITVDPDRDTPAVLKDYLSSFDPRIRALTGTPAEIASVEKSYRVYAKKAPGTGADYAMDHTAVVYLMNKDGQFVSGFNLSQPPKDAAAEIRTYL